MSEEGGSGGMSEEGGSGGGREGERERKGEREREREGSRSQSPFLLAVPDDMVMAVVRKRLEQVDCATRGWVLHGFPLTREQAELLTSTGHNANR